MQIEQQLHHAQQLNLRLQSQLVGVENQLEALFGYLGELQKVTGVPGEQLNTQELFNRVKELASKELEGPSDE